MKKFFITMFFVLTAIAASSENWAKLVELPFPAGQVRIAPSDKGKVVRIPVTVHTDLAFDEFHVSFACCDGLDVVGTEPGEWLEFTYFDQDGMPVSAMPEFEAYDLYFRARTLAFGYERGEDGVMRCYGSVKWDAGYHARMFYVLVSVADNFCIGDILLHGYFAAGADTRGGAFDGIEFFESTSTIAVGYDRGDVNGDGRVNIEDVTSLIDKLIKGN